MSIAFSLTLGDLPLTEYPFSIPFGTDLGAPQNVGEALAFLLQDGEIELSDRASNRTIAFDVLVEGADFADLATNEALLVAETEKPLNRLYVDPGDGFGAVTVFRTFRGQVTLNRDDNFEQARLRRYSLTLRALPHGQSADEVTTPALAASGTTTTNVNNGSATTNWTGAINGASTSPAVVSGAVKVTSSSVDGTVLASLTYTASITTSSTKYIVIDWKPESYFGAPDLRAYGDGVELDRIAQAISPTAGYTRTWFYVTAASVAVLRLDSLSIDGSGISAVRSLAVDNIDRSDVKPTLGSARQLLRSIEVAGSARTQAALAVEHASSSLGDVLVYCFPDVVVNGQVSGYSPPLRQYRNASLSGTQTTDSALVSGAREPITTATATWDVPAAQVIPGAHLLIARVSTSSTASVVFTWAAKVFVGGNQVATTSGTHTETITTGSYVNVSLAKVILPNLDVSTAATSTVVQLSLVAASAATVTLDEAWAFNTSIGRLVQASCGTAAAASGGPARRLWIEPATVIRPASTVRIGHASDGSDAYHPGQAVGTALKGWQFPEFKPPRVNVLTVTSNALDASVTLRHFPTWHTHAAS